MYTCIKYILNESIKKSEENLYRQYSIKYQSQQLIILNVYKSSFVEQWLVYLIHNFDAVMNCKRRMI